MMENEKLLKITEYLINNVFRNETTMFGIADEDTLSDIIYDLIVIIASLHNELWFETRGKYYDYMFHWVNKTTGGCPEHFDDLFKDF